MYRRVSENSIAASEDLREWVLEPAARSDAHATTRCQESLEPMPRLRVIGPGRFERGYLQRLSGLAAEVEIARERELRTTESLRQTSASLEISRRVEHGCQRLVDRLEERLEQRTQALLESERQQKRLVLALGAMQRETELLRSQLQLSGPSGAKHRRLVRR